MDGTLNIIEAKNIEYVYPDKTKGIKKFSLDIKEYERVVLLGSNGCGKSTLLKIFAGLIKPTSGYIKIFEKDINRDNYLFLRKNIGFLFQNPDDFLFNPTVEDELIYTPMQLGLSNKEAKSLISENAKYFGVKKLYEKPPFRLSGGEKKRVALACVLQLKPKLLILDEPTSNIDGKTRKKILQFLDEYKGTMIISTHEIDFVRKISNKVVLLSPKKELLKIGGIELLEDTKYLEAAEII
ncbi:MAG: Trehalose/maltose import ATP-binding protein MalK [Candidatus Methanofastidiosum methylothiophilum]|uniref:Trehalose/maltose import ATP-binding protein MalK n=1 Tax=Candidatus Methanofastidiosum methylothiophilum TaxID=1705564 RepID=A0A150IYF2_9EURY|nr:MAG: Trehalose/maltose import ATP-binding protein MalK [Candidatus Methanofastidiosum methylthiophilus]KYC47437.1 MAG: Trehalose/maltose import ATP-binding protein MalK [Candidatus Methanofastidiosum methylthiophilus]KYC49996.1 MAG: Trehalose/maltose import ATP-binding protein MalK [Candidatus Methanofastidiosum methylthiophilus]